MDASVASGDRERMDTTGGGGTAPSPASLPTDLSGSDPTQDIRVGSLALTAIVENTACSDGLVAEHGLSLLLEVDGRRILFDTGQGPALAPNAARLGVRLEEIDALVLSHGHYDHTGGLAEVLRRNPSLAIYAHPALFEPHFRRHQAPPHKLIAMPPASLEALTRHLGQVTWTRGPTRIASGVWTTGSIPRRSDFEDVGGPFFLDPECLRPDPIEDDQALWVRTDQGVVAILGCAHAGVINTLDHVARLTGVDRFHAVIGGMHLLNADGSRMSRTLDALCGYHIEHLAPCHCTGEQASATLAEAFPEAFCALHAGTRWAIAGRGRKATDLSWLLCECGVDPGKM